MCLLHKVYLLVYVSMPCKDRCDDDRLRLLHPRLQSVLLETHPGTAAFSKESL